MGKPAARITDMHTCPMVTPGTPPVPHVGGPISGPCVPPVLIGGLPAATVGDMCVCVGPPDTIAMGSPTVFIGGKMAARMGDPTMHGGMIAIGMPTVLIGEMGSGGAGGGGGPVGLTGLCPVIASLNDMPLDQRLKAEQDLMAFLPPASAPLAQLKHDRDMAVLAAAPYKRADGAPTVLPPGYSAASPEQIHSLGLSPSQLSPDMNVYSTTNPDGSPHYVMSYRGTETGAGKGTKASDVGTDVLQAVGFNTSAYERGNEAASLAALSGQSVELTGHSKGGGQAAAGSAMSGLPATTFNAAGVHPRTLDRAGVTENEREAAQNNIRAYNNARDPLNAAQDNRGKVLGGIGAVALTVFGWLGAAAVAALGADGALPQALGQRITVPPASTQGTGLGEGHSIDTMIQALNEQVSDQLAETCGC